MCSKCILIAERQRITAARVALLRYHSNSVNTVHSIPGEHPDHPMGIQAMHNGEPLGIHNDIPPPSPQDNIAVPHKEEGKN